jgi:GTP diphosphokinase / guanosine-3',5'-bis(diphosphate) 3'-diphosphatase
MIGRQVGSAPSARASGEPASNAEERRSANEASRMPPAAARPGGVKAVLARLPFDIGLHVPELVQPLVARLKSSVSKSDLRLIVHAYHWAQQAYENQIRGSDGFARVHPIGTAEALADLGMDTPTIVAALLRDVLKHTRSTSRDLAADFGDEVAMLVGRVADLERVQASSGQVQQAEPLRKMLIAVAGDYRVLLIRLADQLHTMRAAHHLPRAMQSRVARETLEIYAPLAHRLGMQDLKWQLEDLAFATMHPKRYDEIKSMVRERQPERDRYIEQLSAEIEQRLRSVKIRAEISARPKHYYSIYEKMVRRGMEFAEIYDVVGIRIIVDSVRDCYAALGTVHARWHPVALRFKDYIAMPKFNLYQSLHTTVVGPAGKAVEVQIRTEAMHRTAEYGIAAYWKYRQTTQIDHPGTRGLSQMIDRQAQGADVNEFLSNIRLDLCADEVFLFTPRGEIKALPRGSTPVDFAYAIHTEVGHRTVGARVNGVAVPLSAELRNGETVEIVTSKAPDAGPSRQWLEFVRSSRARARIKQSFSRDRRVDTIEQGHLALRRELARQHVAWKRLMTGSELTAVATDLGYADLDALYHAIGDGDLSPQQVAQHLVGRLADEDETDEPTIPSDGGRPSDGADAVTVEGYDDVVVNLAQCCCPVLGDDVDGFVTRGRGVSVHRHDCSNAETLRRTAERRVGIVWDTSTQAVFRVTVQVEAVDRKHLLRDITTVLGDLHINILGAQITTHRDHVSKLRFTFELADIAHLDHILGQVRAVESVYDAYRVVPRRPA